MNTAITQSGCTLVDCCRHGETAVRCPRIDCPVFENRPALIDGTGSHCFSEDCAAFATGSGSELMVIGSPRLPVAAI